MTMNLTHQQLRDVRIWAVEVSMGRHAAYNAAVAQTGATPISWLMTDVIAQAGLLEKYILGDRDVTNV